MPKLAMAAKKAPKAALEFAWPADRVERIEAPT
jgi:hypothetical protein